MTEHARRQHLAEYYDGLILLLGYQAQRLDGIVLRKSASGHVSLFFVVKTVIIMWKNIMIHNYFHFSLGWVFILLL
jgi:hypothetical protein